jgi:hypothetical protein
MVRPIGPSAESGRALPTLGNAHPVTHRTARDLHWHEIRFAFRAEDTHMATESWLSDWTSIAQLRDELRVKAHLLRADLRDEWNALEKRWETLERETRPVRDAVGASARELGSSTRALLTSVGQGYRRIRDSFSAGHV